MDSMGYDLLRYIRVSFLTRGKGGGKSAAPRPFDEKRTGKGVWCGIVCWPFFLEDVKNLGYLHPRSLSWNLKKLVSNRNMVFRFHVKLQGCIEKNNIYIYIHIYNSFFIVQFLLCSNIGHMTCQNLLLT